MVIIDQFSEKVQQNKLCQYGAVEGSYRFSKQRTKIKYYKQLIYKFDIVASPNSSNISRWGLENLSFIIWMV